MLLLGGYALSVDDPRADAALTTVETAITDLVGDAERLDPAEIVNLMKLSGLAGELGFWRSHYVATGRRLLAEGDGARPPRLATLPPRRITIGARASCTALAGAPESDDAPDPIWLAAREGPIVVTPRVRALAERLAAGHADPAQTVHAFHDHLLDRFTCGVVHYDRIGARPATDWVLETRWYDCRLGAALLAALCRARGIPARLVGGYLLWRTPTEHFWVEVYLPERGWTAFDLLSWDLSAGGTDREWRSVFADAVGYRARTQVLPRIFTGAAGGATAPAWHRLVRATGSGTETRYLSVPDSQLLYREEVRIIE